MPLSCEDVANAFCLLNSYRPHGAQGEPRLITLQDVKTYLDIHPTDDPDRFVTLLQATDLAFIKAAPKK